MCFPGLVPHTHIHFEQPREHKIQPLSAQQNLEEGTSSAYTRWEWVVQSPQPGWSSTSSCLNNSLDRWLIHRCRAGG